MYFCQISLRPGVPLQSTLFSLCQSAAQGWWGVGRRRIACRGAGWGNLAERSDPAWHRS